MQDPNSIRLPYHRGRPVLVWSWAGRDSPGRKANSAT